jgi:hypothetical protein
MALFAGWVAFPFICPFLVERWMGVRVASARRALSVSMIVLAILSAALYGRSALNPPRTKAAALFVVTPIVSLLSLAISTIVAAAWAKRRSAA